MPANALMPSRNVSKSDLRMRPVFLLGFVLLLTSLTGCAYRVGPTNGERAGSRSMQVNPFENKTIEPRLVEAVTFAMRKQVQQDGTYKLNTHDEGDIIVSGAIVTYERRPISFQSRDAITPRD